MVSYCGTLVAAQVFAVARPLYKWILQDIEDEKAYKKPWERRAARYVKSGMHNSSLRRLRNLDKREHGADQREALTEASYK